MAKVAIIVGSDSDVAAIRSTEDILREFGVSFETHIYSAHRTPGAVIKFLGQVEKKRIQIIIAGAGMAAHLAGVIAAHTLVPVIGIPMEGKLEGLDSLLSTVQMPRGVPVGTMAIGKTGAYNAALYAIHILALSDQKLLQHLKRFRKKMEKEVLEKDKKLKKG